MGYYAEQFKLTMPQWNNMNGTQSPAYVPSPMWQNNNMYSWDSPAWGTYNPIFGNTQSSQPKKELTESEKREIKKKEREEKAKKVQEINAQKAEVEKAKEELETTYVKQKDGSYKQVEKLHGASFSKKLKVIADGFLTGGFKLAEGFLGPRDENGKRNWKTIAKNLGIAALCFGATFIPVVGPFVSAGLLAVGAVAGGKMVFDGGKKLVKCIKDENATLDDLKNSVEDLTAGGMIIGASVAGLKGMSKAAGTKCAFGAATEMAKADIKTINTFKAAGNNGFTSFFKTLGSKATTFWRKNSKKETFESSKNKTTQQIETRQAELGGTSGTTPKENAFNKMESDLLDGIKSDINAGSRETWSQINGKEGKIAKFKDQLKALRKDFADGKDVEINGQIFNKSTDTELFYQKINNLEQTISKTYVKPLNNLAKMKHNAIKESVFKGLKSDNNEVMIYFGKQGNWFQNTWRVLAPEKFTWKTIPSTAWACVWKLPMLPFNISNTIIRSGAAAGYTWEQALAPAYAEGFLESIMGMFGKGPQKVSAEEYTQLESNITEMETELNKQLKELHVYA